MLKLLGCFFMVVDHFGVLFYPDFLLFRIVGRLALPIFAYLVSLGFSRSSNVFSYAKRLFICAVVSQFPFYLIFGMRLNSVFSFFLGVLVLLFLRSKFSVLRVSIAVVFSFLISEIFRFDYGFYGVLLVLIFYYFRGRNFIRYLLIFASAFLYVVVFPVQLFSVFAVVFTDFLKFPELKRGRINKYFFYVFYPVHMLVLWALSVLL